jgi:hypothetical protein
MPPGIALILLIALAAGCSAPGSTTVPADSGIEGQVLLGPICPVVAEGEECPDRPYQATLTVQTRAGRQVVQFETDQNGKFRVPLAPGEYVLHPESPGGIPYGSDQPFTVLPGVFTRLTVTYDSGIR